ncbi:hypothetical protein K0B96_14270 [Horticoccus luteus]|uniref:Lipoprotein n=1 Tax=Horticoccus luteus TaxID=2862869 RepID=A0A8F9TSW8_9BACT|nr:hypothetical protein [Horticoccus luteus]QYM78450.1 hypothetical protein K0B96_14270 [Horticoccus luteus]
MKRLALVLPLAGLVLGGCSTLPSTREVIPASGHIALVTDFAPTQTMMSVGTTAFQNKQWDADTGFDANAEALAVAQASLTRQIKTANGRDVGLPPPSPESAAANPALAERLAALGREWQVDLILVLTSTDAPDWLYRTSMLLDDVGLYRREVFGMKRSQVYGVFALRAFDCRTGQFTAVDRQESAREVPHLDWHDTWSAYSAREQRHLLLGWHELFKDAIPPLLTKAGLATAPEARQQSAAKSFIFAPNRAKSWLPEGNTLEIPHGITRTQAHLAVLNGLKARRWMVVSDAPDRVVGVYRDDKKEAGVTAVISDQTITLTPDDHEVHSDGSRTPASYERWQRNVKESIYRELLNADPAEAPAS